MADKYRPAVCWLTLADNSQMRRTAVPRGPPRPDRGHHVAVDVSATQRLGSVRWITGVVGVMLLLVAVALAFDRIYIHDTYCGRVFYDRQSGCEHRMAVQTAWTAVVGGMGLVMLTVPAIAHAARVGRWGMVIAVVLGVAAGALALVGLNRILQPEPTGCGSIVNPQQACDRLMKPYRRAAVISFGSAALAAGGAAVAVMWQRRRGLPATHETLRKDGQSLGWWANN